MTKLAKVTNYDVTRVGVVADTHIPDRISTLHPDLIPRLRAERIELLLHAGDISEMSVLEKLSEVAPVLAVTGNRDRRLHKLVPLEQHLTVNGVKVFMAHGVGSFAHYVRERVIGLSKGYLFERYREYLLRRSEGAKVIVFGDVHRVETRWIDGVLYFNPGSPAMGYRPGKPLSFGVLDFSKQHEPRGIIVPLRQNWN